MIRMKKDLMIKKKDNIICF